MNTILLGHDVHDHPDEVFSLIRGNFITDSHSTSLVNRYYYQSDPEEPEEPEASHNQKKTP